MPSISAVPERLHDFHDGEQDHLPCVGELQSSTPPRQAHEGRHYLLLIELESTANSSIFSDSPMIEEGKMALWPKDYQNGFT